MRFGSTLCGLLRWIGAGSLMLLGKSQDSMRVAITGATGASRLGRFLSAAIALFWLPRIPIQLFVYDSESRRQHRPGDVAILLAIGFMVPAFGVAAVGLYIC
jgi:hypothetical protein